MKTHDELKWWGTKSGGTSGAYYIHVKPSLEEIDEFCECLASSPGLLTFSGVVQGFKSLAARLAVRLAEHVQGDAVVHVLPGANPIDRLLHLAMAAVASFHGVGGGRQQFIVQERQRLVQVGGMELIQHLANLLEPANPPTQLGQFRQGGVRAATPIKQAVHFLHEVAQGSQLA